MIDVFRIGVNLSMSGNAQQFLGILLKDMLKLNEASVMLKKNFAGLRGAALGITAAFGGIKGLEGIWHIIKASSELNTSLERTKQLGGEFAANIDKTRAQAFATTYAVPTTTASQVVDLQRELATQLQHPSQASALVTAASKVAYAVGNLTGEKPEELIKNMVRTADELGSIFTKGPDGKERVDPDKVMATMKFMGRGLELTTGYLNSREALQMAKQMSLVSKQLTPEAFFAELFEMAVSYGGAKTGTAMTSGAQQLLGGVMPQRVAKADIIAGILKSSEVHHNKGGGGGVTIDPSAAKRLSQMETDPVRWMNEGGRAAVDRYMKITGSTFLVAVMRLFSRQNVQRLFAQGMWNDASFTRAREIWRAIPDPEDQQKMLMKEQLQSNIDAVTASWTTMIQALGDPGVPAAISVMHGLTAVVQEVTRAANDNPRATKLLLELGAGISALAVVVGGIKVADFGLKALSAGLKSLSQVFLGSTLTRGVELLAAGLRKLLGPVSLIYDLLNPTAANKGEDDELKKRGLAHPGTPAPGPRVTPTPSERMHDYGKKLLDYQPAPTFMPMSYQVPAAANRNATLIQEIAYRRGVEDGAGARDVDGYWSATGRRNAGAGGAARGGPVDVRVVEGSVHAHVTNGRDLHNGMVEHLGRALDRPAPGTTNFDGRTSPYATLMGA